MRGNPHVRFLEGKMAVMSSSYSTSTSVPNPCEAERPSSIRPITRTPALPAISRTLRIRRSALTALASSRATTGCARIGCN